MNQLNFTKTRIIFLLGFALIVSAILYSFRTSDKLQAITLAIVGLIVTSGALIYVLVKNIKQDSKTSTSHEAFNTPGDLIAGLIEILAYMFFV